MAPIDDHDVGVGIGDQRIGEPRPDAGVAESVRQAIDAGVAGLSIEDSTGDSTRPLYTVAAAVERMRAARRAIDEKGSDTLLRPMSVAYTSTKHAVTGLTKCISLDGRKDDITASQIDIGNALAELALRMASGVPRADGSIKPEPLMDVKHVGDAVLHIFKSSVNNIADLEHPEPTGPTRAITSSGVLRWSSCPNFFGCSLSEETTASIGTTFAGIALMSAFSLIAGSLPALAERRVLPGRTATYPIDPVSQLS